MRTIAFHSLGCRVNFEEVECLSGQFLTAGYRVVPFREDADVYVVNTCTVTSLADSESRKFLRRAIRQKRPGGIVAVTGCYAQRDPETLRALDGVDLILGNSEKSQLLEHLLRFEEDRRQAGDLFAMDAADGAPEETRVLVSSVPRTQQFLAHDGGSSQLARTRATLKIQDGCDEKCTYCIIPTVRGASVSRNVSEVLAEAKGLAIAGHREIALTGVNTGCYGHDLGDQEGLSQLVRRLHAMRLGVRFRLNSLEPATVTSELLDALEDCPSFCHHFHIPLQHGDSRILRRMGRSYDAEFYRAAVLRVAERFPHAGIGADVMVGFPGETQTEFDNCRRFLAELPLTYLHVFTYSQRDGTSATRLTGHVEAAEKAARSRSLHELDEELRTRFLLRLRGREQVLLVESKRGPRGLPTGLTSAYVRAELDVGAPTEHEFWRVRFEGWHEPRLAQARAIERVS